MMSNRSGAQDREKQRTGAVDAARALALCLGFMTLLRFLAFFLTTWDRESWSWGDRLAVFGMGLRFDLLVVGFLLIPVALSAPVAEISLSRRRAWFWVVEGYLQVTWFVSFAWLTLGVFFFAVQGRPLTGADFQQNGLRLLLSAGERMGDGTVVCVLAIAACAWFIFARSLHAFLGRARERQEAAVSRVQRVVRVLGLLVFTALAARGTVTPHHLERAHANVTDDPQFNLLALNALWTFDKDPERRP